MLISIIFFTALLMTMTGRGGGNFYVLILLFSGVSIHQATTVSQFILMITALTASLFFKKEKIIAWKLFFIIGSITSVSSFFGGLFSDFVPSKTLKIIFAILLLIASLLMLKPIKTRKIDKKSIFILNINSGKNTFFMDIRLALPIIVFSGFFAGMVGVSGGSFLVPLMVLSCNVPMNIAVATSASLVSITAFTGFLGHTFSGHFNLLFALPLGIAGAIGGILGSKIVIRSKPKSLKILFAFTTFLAAIAMFVFIYR